MTVLGPHYDGKHTGFAKQYCYYVKSYYRKSFNNWHQSAASTSQTGIILQPTSNLHASLWNIPKQEMADYLTPWVWTEHTRSAITWPGFGGLALFLDLALPRPRSRLFSQGQDQDQDLRCQGQDLHEVSSRILEAKARPRGQQDCWSRHISEVECVSMSWTV